MPMFEFMLRSIIARFDKNRAPGVSITDSPELARKLTPENQAQIVSVAAPILKGIQDVVMQSQYIKKLHTWTLVDESVIQAAVDQSQLSQINQSFNNEPNTGANAIATAATHSAPAYPNIDDDPDPNYLINQEPPPDDDYVGPAEPATFFEALTIKTNLAEKFPTLESVNREIAEVQKLLKTPNASRKPEFEAYRERLYWRKRKLLNMNNQNN
jgi:DNA primase